MTRRHAAVAIALGLLLLLVARRRPAAIDQPAPVADASRPAVVETAGAAVRALQPVPAPARPAPPAVAPTIGWLRVDAVRADGTPEPDAVVRVARCNDADRVRGGHDWEWQAEPGPCTVVGWRKDGLLETARQFATVEVTPGTEAVVTFTFPIERTGGIGIAYEWTDLGPQVLEVHPASPAEEAGLEPGDIVVEVDGVETAGLTGDEYIALMTGPEGTDVTFVVAFEGDTGMIEEVIEATRALLKEY